MKLRNIIFILILVLIIILVSIYFYMRNLSTEPKTQDAQNDSKNSQIEDIKNETGQKARK